MTAVKDDVTTGARQQDIYSKATNAGFVPNKDNTGFTIVYGDDVYIYDAGLSLVKVEPVPDSKNDGDTGDDGDSGDGDTGGGTGGGGDSGDSGDGDTGGGTNITAITDETILSLMEQDPIVRREVNSLQAMTNKRQETLQAGGDIDYIDSIIEKQKVKSSRKRTKSIDKTVYTKPTEPKSPTTAKSTA